MKTLIIMIVGLIGFVASDPAFSGQEGAKALFFGDTVKQTTEVKTTSSGAAAFSGTELSEQTIAPPSGGKQSANSSATSGTTTTAAAKNRTPKSKTALLATGLSYWIEVVMPDGKIARHTPDSRVFKSGERIRFAFRTNREGYLYLMLIGSSGRGRTLFPDPRINKGDNLVTMNLDYKIPFGDKSFVMDATPGEERVLVFFSESPIAEMSGFAVPAKAVENDQVKKVYALAETSGSKDILFEEDAQGLGFQPASYIVSKSSDPKTVIFREIVLRHK